MAKRCEKMAARALENWRAAVLFSFACPFGVFCFSPKVDCLQRTFHHDDVYKTVIVANSLAIYPNCICKAECQGRNFSSSGCTVNPGFTQCRLGLALVQTVLEDSRYDPCRLCRRRFELAARVTVYNRHLEGSLFIPLKMNFLASLTQNVLVSTMLAHVALLD